MQQFTVRQLTLAGFGLALVAVFALVALAWDFAKQNQRTQDWVSHTTEVIAAMRGLEVQFFHAETNQRAYLVAQAPEFMLQREAAVASLRRQLDAVAQLTLDSTTQQNGIAELRPLLELRAAEHTAMQKRLTAGEDVPLKVRLADGTELRSALIPRFQLLLDEERRLLEVRKNDDLQQAVTTQRIFGAVAVGIALLLAAACWRVDLDLSARSRAERAAEIERRYNAAHAQALTLYNATNQRVDALDGTLALLSQDPAFAVSAFYAHEELGGVLRLITARGAPADTQTLLNVSESVVGTVATERKAIYLESFGRETALRIETGLATLKPAAMLMAPVLHQGSLLGVLVLATARRLTERDRSFIDRLCAQLGVALHNLGQIEGLNQLARQLQQSADEIHHKNQQVEHASRLKSEFVANMSHELRTPLNAVIGFSQILRDGLAGSLNDEQREYIVDIHDSGRHLLSLINDVLDLSKVEAGLMTLEPAALDLAELAASAIAVVRERAASRRLKLECRVLTGRAQVWLDPRKTKQIAYNLLANAVKFTPEGGEVTLTLRRVDQQRVASARPDDATRLFMPPAPSADGWLEITVADSGIGIEPEALRRLFQPFVQIDSSLSRKFEGTGLGLTMVQRLIELHGGGLSLHSAAGKGSTFTVWLPWRAAPEGSADATAAAAAAAALPPPLRPSAPAPASVSTPSSVSNSTPAKPPTSPPASTPASPPAPGPAAAPGSAPDRAISPASAAVAAAVALPVGRTLGEAEPAATVLVVDDDANAVELLRWHLEAAGHRVESVGDAERAVQLAAELRPQAIVLDIIFAKMSGWEVLAQLKHNAATQDIPVVIVSVTDEPHRGFALGAAQVLVKPVSGPELLAALAAAGMNNLAGGAQVLIVDDDPKIVGQLSQQLQAGGCTPTVVYGGQQALEAVHLQRPDVIVLDLMMPQVSGFDVLEALNRRAETADIPIIVLTSKQLSAQDRASMRGRVQRVLEKSDFQPASLLAEVKRAVAHRRQLRA